MIDEPGRYALQIFSAERPNFAARDKAGGGGDAENARRRHGASSHFGSLAVDWAANALGFAIEDSSFEPVRTNTDAFLHLARRCAELGGRPGPDGAAPISIWRLALPLR
jgi:hypothetical protein